MGAQPQQPRPRLDPPPRFAPTALHRAHWPARDKHRSPLDVEEGSCPKESDGHPGSQTPPRSSRQQRYRSQETCDSIALPCCSSAEQQAMQTAPSATPGGLGSAPAATHTSRNVWGLLGDTGLHPPCPSMAFHANQPQPAPPLVWGHCVFPSIPAQG